MLARLKSAISVLSLKILAAGVTAAGGAIALFGEPRAAGGMTSWGYLALSMIVAGLGLSAAIETIQWRSDREDRDRAKIEDAAQREWRLVVSQPLISIAFSFMHRVSLPVQQFLDHVSRITFIVTSDPHVESPKLPVHLSVSRVSDDTDFESSHAWVASRSAQVVAHSDGLSLFRPAEPQELTRCQTHNSVDHEDEGPNEVSEAESRLRSVTSRVEAITMVVDGGRWGYTSSNDDVWDQNRPACGLYGSIQWSSLGFGSGYQTLEDLSRLRSVQLVLPRGMSLRAVDECKLTFVGSRGLIESVDFSRSRFAQRQSDGCWELSMRGHELRAALESQFIQEKAKELSGEYEERPG